VFIFVLFMLQLSIWGPHLLGRIICFSQSTDSDFGWDVSLTPKHTHSYIWNNIGANIGVLSWPHHVDLRLATIHELYNFYNDFAWLFLISFLFKVEETKPWKIYWLWYIAYDTKQWRWNWNEVTDSGDHIPNHCVIIICSKIDYLQTSFIES
jgi:hypothetical protein